MKIHLGKADVPVVYTAHHASCYFGEFTPRVALTQEQKIRFSDYGTHATVPQNGMAAIVAGRSRGVVDLNRAPDDPGRFPAVDFAKPTPHCVWLPGMAPTEAEKQFIHQTYYAPFHQAILDMLISAGPQRPRLVVSWDNTAHYQIGKNESGQPVTMPPIILSNRGAEGSATGNVEQVSCSPAFLELLAERLRAELAVRGLPHTVHVNLVYKGGYITRRYSTLRNAKELRAHGIQGEVQSLQVEYDTHITHNQNTLAAHNANIEALRLAFEAAIGFAYRQYFGQRGNNYTNKPSAVQMDWRWV